MDFVTPIITKDGEVKSFVRLALAWENRKSRAQSQDARKRKWRKAYVEHITRNNIEARSCVPAEQLGRSTFARLKDAKSLVIATDTALCMQAGSVSMAIRFSTHTKSMLGMMVGYGAVCAKDGKIRENILFRGSRVGPASEQGDFAESVEFCSVTTLPQSALKISF
ncbi:hypothetical protein OIE67_53295 [Nonomuraea fuscirosea]|uniref:hypothetical protein n=1 Tax=Nonomuraea fuscirosea TaxID=1291556 RepID=UPI002DDB4279|nr:hypothetical protein [Nonomuraea fuscirosea]WSA52696.1 hypothetical protein OIE67_53295 [Nonomuraea fuscirosea]